jgi:hypothetical protein
VDGGSFVVICHLDEMAMDDYALGLMPEEEVADFEEHLLLCVSCQERLTQNDAFIKALKGASSEHVREKAQWRYAWRARLPVLATLAAGLLLVAGTAVRHLGQPAGQPAIVTLEAYRGAAAEAWAPAARELVLHFDLLGLPDLPSYELEIVDRWGTPVSRVDAAPGAATVPALRAGSYYIRLYAPGGQLLREYGFEVSDRQR